MKRQRKSNELAQRCTILSPKPSILLQAKKSPQYSRGFHAMYNSRTHLWQKRARGSFLPDRAFTLDTSYTLTPSPFSTALSFPSSPSPPPTIVSDDGRRGQLSSANKKCGSRSHRLARYRHQHQQTVEMPLEVAVVAKKIRPKHKLSRSKQAVEQSSESEAGSGGSRGSTHYTTTAGNVGPTGNKVKNECCLNF